MSNSKRMDINILKEDKINYDNLNIINKKIQKKHNVKRYIDLYYDKKFIDIYFNNKKIDINNL